MFLFNLKHWGCYFPQFVKYEDMLKDIKVTEDKEFDNYSRISNRNLNDNYLKLIDDRKRILMKIDYHLEIGKKRFRRSCKKLFETII